MADDLSQRIRGELELENSPFLASLEQATKETSAFLSALDQLGDELVPLTEGETKLTRQTREQADAAAQAARHTKELAEEEEFLATVLPDVEKAADRAAEATKRKAGAVSEADKAAAAYSRAMNQLSYALSDFFSAQGDIGQKFNSIANNLQMVAFQMGATGPVFLAMTGLITLIQVLSRNWDSLVGLFKNTDTQAAAESIDKITEALNKLTAAQQKQADQRKATEAQKAAGRGFARALGQVGGAQGALRAASDLGWDVGQFEELLNRGLSGEDDAVKQLGEWINSSGRGRNGQMPILSPLGKFYRSAVGEQATRRRIADSKMLGEEGAKIEDETFRKAYDENNADQKATEAHNAKVIDQAARGLEAIMQKGDQQAEARGAKADRAAANWAKARSVQEEAFNNYGEQIDINTAMQIAKQREAQMKGLQNEAINTLLGTQADFMAELQMARQWLAQARRIQQQNRTFQMMGGN